MELTARLVKGVTLHGGVGYTDTKIGKNTPLQLGLNTTSIFPIPTGFTTTSTVDVSGQPFNLAPKWQGNGENGARA